MKHLLEIAAVITRKKVKKIEIFDEASLRNKSSKFNEFFESLMDGKYKNDRDAATALYGCSPTDDKYRQLKSRFRKRLMNTLFFIDVNLPGNSNYERAYYTCNKDWTLVRILHSYGAVGSAYDLAKQVLAIAEKFRFSDIIVHCARLLREEASELKEFKNVLNYNKYIQEFYPVFESELKVEELLNQIAIIEYNEKSTDKASNEIEDLCNKIMSIAELNDSPNINYNSYQAWLNLFELRKDYSSAIEVVERTEEYIKQNPQFEQPTKMISFQLHKMAAFLYTNNFSGARRSVEANIHLFAENSNDWYQYMELYYLQTLRSEQYQIALAIHQKVVTQAKFKKSPRVIREKWNMFKYYHEFYIDTAITNLTNEQRRNFETKSGKLLDDPALFPKELRIITVHTVIAQFIYALQLKRYSQAAETVDRLKTYLLRQLKGKEFLRLGNFIKLLTLLVKANFQPVHLNNEDKILLSIKESPNYYFTELNSLEVLPYEKLWTDTVSKLS